MDCLSAVDLPFLLSELEEIRDKSELLSIEIIEQRVNSIYALFLKLSPDDLSLDVKKKIYFLLGECIDRIDLKKNKVAHYLENCIVDRPTPVLNFYY